MGSKAVRFKDHNGNAVYPCPYYPVGSIYINVNNINPGNYFGGTWEQVKDMFLLCCGDKYVAGSTGGEAEHKLTIDEMPSHKHEIRPGMFPTNTTSGNSGFGADWHSVVHMRDSDYFDPKPAGGDKAHNNMPPYLAVYVWKRTA